MLKSEPKYEAEPMDTADLLYDFEEEGEIHSSGDERKDSWKAKTENDAYRVTSTFGRPFSDVSEAIKTRELRKLERAKRFAIDIGNPSDVTVNNEILSRLHRSLGVDKDNERHYRFNAIHMRGTQDMSTKDVFEYFSSFTPSYVEWINDVSCNVVWADDASVAKALVNISKEIKNLDKVHLNADPFEKDLKDMDSDMCYTASDDAVDAREIKAAIPPGLWRIGIETDKSPAILLRFATRSDRKQRNAEKNSDYYKRYGNPHFGNLPGLVSKSLRTGVFQKYKKFQNNNDEDDDGNGRKNPWGHLAQEWNEMDKSFRHDRPKAHVKSRITLKRSHPVEQEDLRISINSKQRQKILKIKHSESGESSQSDDNDARESRLKVPKMRMYSDAEEKSRNTSKNRLSSQIRLVEDLRNKIDRRRRNKQMIGSGQSGGVSKRYCNKLNAAAYDSDSYEDEDEEKGSNWALEQYSDLRESLEQKSRQNKAYKQTRTVERSESEENESDNESDVYNGHLGHRSPLQIEIENDEYFENESI